MCDAVHKNAMKMFTDIEPKLFYITKFMITRSGILIMFFLSVKYSNTHISLEQPSDLKHMLHHC
jgi:hypothetical protein